MALPTNAPVMMQIGDKVRNLVEDPIIADIMYRYEMARVRWGLSEKLPQTERKNSWDWSAEELEVMSNQLDKLIDEYSTRCVELILEGKLNPPRRNNNPWYIAKVWFYKKFLDLKPGVNERIWTEMERRASEANGA